MKLVYLLSFVILLLPAEGLSEGVHVHNQVGKVRCLDCHVTLPLKQKVLSFNQEIKAVCAKCHKETCGQDGHHPVDVRPSMEIPPDMFLDEKGMLTCITCHSFHAGWGKYEQSRPNFLRRPPGRTFCFYCHKEF